VTDLTHRLERTLVIRASRDTVFTFFTDNDRWASWWGKGSTIEAHKGGRLKIRHPNGVEVSGEVLDVAAPARIVFTYGYESGAPIPAGGSRVTIELVACDRGTRLRLTHEFPDAAPRDEHVQGWRFQLSLFANLIANTVNHDAATLVDRWLAAWSEPDPDTRNATLDDIVARGVTFGDRFSCIEGLDELRAHLAAVHRFMPGMTLERDGDVRHCQWLVLADWVARAADGQQRGRGTNAFTLDAQGRICAVTGFWAA